MELESVDEYVVGDVKIEGDNDLDDIINDFGGIEIDGELNKNCYHLLKGDFTQFKQAVEGYLGFLKNKIIANPKDKIGLILYSVGVTANNLKFQGVNVVSRLEIPTAKRIKEAENMLKNVTELFRQSENPSNLHEVLWVFDNEIKEIDKRKNHVRLFLFTANDSPHPVGSHERLQSIAHAKKLAEVGVEIELFPLEKMDGSRFDIRQFFTAILTVDEDELNSGVFDSSDKIMDLKHRLKQKQHKKRALNRLLFKIGEDTSAAVKIFALFHKAKKPPGQKLHARTNKPLKRIVKLTSTEGEPLFQTDIQNFYPLGGEKVLLGKGDMKELKSIEPPGLTLIGFKPLDKLKPIHNYRTSYFIYPDQEYVTGSSQLVDALIERMTERNQLAIVKFVPRVGSQVRFCALLPQKEVFDETHSQMPPGFSLVFLPYSDDLVSFSNPTKVQYPGVDVSAELVQVTKIFINNFTMTKFDPKNFSNPSLQLFYNTLQANALGETDVEPIKDVMMPGAEVVNKYRDLLNLLDETVLLEAGGGVPAYSSICNSMVDDDLNQPKKKVKKENSKVKEAAKDSDSENGANQEVETCLRTGDFKELTINKLKDYLKSRSLKVTGNKEQLINRALSYMMS